MHPSHTLFDLPLHTANVNGIRVAFRRSAVGKPPLLLLHGHPQTHVLWHKVWDSLCEHFSCVAMDLRGYGDSGKPAADATATPAPTPTPPNAIPHALYSKRVMAQDAVGLMAQLGYPQFKILAHDRGARVAHRLLLDHPNTVQAASLLDIAPTLDMYRNTDEAFARAYYHWFFLIQPAPLPETLLGHDPAYYCRNVMAGRFNAVGERGFGPFDPRAMAEYERVAGTLGWVHSVCEDYRASASIDLQHDQASRDTGQTISQPLQILWGEQGVVHRCFEPLKLWQAQAALPVVGKALPCGHYIAEEAPQALLDAAVPFLLGH
jgi:haloacetate dehalogenase